MIPYGRQSINDEDIVAVVQALKGDFLTTGPLVEQFEREIEKVVGAPCVVVSSGTAALHCAYAAIGIESGDEIITPPITFIATQATAALMGAKIVFADIQLDTGNIDPKAVEAAITPRTKAIVAVDFAGHPADLDELRAIADKHSVFLIEDAAHAIGSIYKKRPVGSIADLTTFSFFPTKNITTSEGGAVSSTKTEILERVKKFSRQGLVRTPSQFKLTEEGPWHQEVHEFGLNYRLPDVLCALGIAQLDRLEVFKERRQKIRDIYSQEFVFDERVHFYPPKSYVDPMWHLAPIFVNPNHRLRIFTKLREKGIGVQVNYLPVYRHPVFKESFNSSSFPNSERHYASEISLPMSAHLSDSDIAFICKTLKETL